MGFVYYSYSYYTPRFTFATVKSVLLDVLVKVDTNCHLSCILLEVRVRTVFIYGGDIRLGLKVD